MKRLYNLDYLRGLAAFGIMINHLLIWTRGEYNSENFMGRIGIYGVAIFYVLSGMAMYLVYHKKMVPSKPDLIDFIKKRFLRIFPLMWLVTIATIVLSGVKPDALKVFLNLSGLFGFISWHGYFAPGAWSIGNELVFYAFFPVFIFFANRSKTGLFIFSTLLFAIYIYFAFFLLDENIDLGSQWRNYVNPLNQVFLFLSGFLIVMFLKNKQINNRNILILLLAAIALFVFYPASGDTINLVTGITRLVFTAICIVVCISFFKLTFKLPNFIHKPLTILGEASYSVYLLHPLIYKALSLLFSQFGATQDIPLYLLAIISGILTLLASYLVYWYFERYFMRSGRGKEIVT